MSLDEVLWRGAALVFSHLNFYPLILHVFSRKKFFFHYYITWKKEVSLQTVELWFQTCPLRSRVLHNRFNKNYLHLYYVLLLKVISTAVVWLFWIGPSEGERGGKFKRRWCLILNWVKTKKLGKLWWAKSGWFELSKRTEFILYISYQSH